MSSPAPPHRLLRDQIRHDLVARIRRSDPETGRRHLLRRLDAALAQVPAADRGPVACRSGCSFCCHLRVMATAPEVFGLLDFQQSRLGNNDFTRFRETVELAAARLHALPGERLLQVNLPCPLLQDGACSAYAGRPLNCRSYHSLDRAACEAAFAVPDQDLGHPQYAAVARVHGAVQGGFMDALAATGHDPSQVELVTGLAEAMADADCRGRYQRGETVFRVALRVA